MASIALISIALSAGSTPASIPETTTTAVAPTAAQNPICGSLNITTSEEVMSIMVDTPAMTATPTHNPTSPAKVVSKRLSDIT